MLNKLKRALYFPVAHYFRFFAKIQLARWKPRIIVVTGSSGKTTLLNLLESQIGKQARYSHHANSAFGIPFDILGLKRESLTKEEWLKLFFQAPLQAWEKPPTQQLYVVEADCDRPGEGQFLGSLLQPEVVLWLNVSKTHSQNFPSPVEESIAQEFGYFLEYCTQHAFINADSALIAQQKHRTTQPIDEITQKSLQDYQVEKNRTHFIIDHNKYSFNFLLPEETFYSIAMTLALIDYLKLSPNSRFSEFHLPPGRSSVFAGVKDTTLIDSTYNANFDSMRVILEMFQVLPAKPKWVVLGDMIEQGSQEQLEHERLAKLLADLQFERVVLMGPRVYEYTYPKLKPMLKKEVIIERFLVPKEVLEYLQQNISGGETILFKGARFLEGVVEQLLANKQDSTKLCRREKIWQQRRKEWGL